MISSLIDVYEARRRKSKALKNYKKIVDAIKSATDKGESGVYVPDRLFTHNINERLWKDGFEKTTNNDQKGNTWIWWG